MLTPLNSLKKGLHTLRNQVQDWKSRIESNLNAGKAISEINEEWLDGNGNLISKEQVVQDLEEASNDERGLERLDMESRGIVQKLQVLGGGHQAPVGKKLNIPYFFIMIFRCPLSHKQQRSRNGEAFDKRPVKIAKTKEGTYVLNFGWHRPVFYTLYFYRVHVCHPLFNDYPQIIHMQCMEHAPFRFEV